MKCVIVDDEPLALDLLESYVRKTPFLELTGKYSSAVQAMKELNGRPVDLIFLDIQMPELNGLEFSKILPPDTRIVFTTAFDQYALDGYKVNALDYLLKPISYVDFLRAADKALHWFERVQSARPREEEIDSIFVKSEYKLVQIELRNILYVEGLKDYIKIYEEDSPKPVLSLMSMKAMEDLLPASQFIRVHRSYIPHHRPRTHRLRQNLHPHQRQLQADVSGIPGPQELRTTLRGDCPGTGQTR